MPKAASRKNATEANADAGSPDPVSLVPAGSKSGGKEAGKGTAKKTVRKPARKTFLVAAKRDDGQGRTTLAVYAAVTRSPAEALAVARAALGPDVALELTGKLSNRMAKALGLKASEVRPI